MQIIRQYINNFFQRAGSYVLLATIFARLLSFFASWIALQLIDNKELGIVIFAFTIISFFIPLGGLGLYQSLIRYAPFLKTNTEKDNLFIYCLQKGLIASLFLIIIIVLGSFFINFSFDKTRSYLIFLAFIIIPSYIFELIKIQFRLKHNNKLFAVAELIYTIILVGSVFTLSYFYKEKGYALALFITPLLATLLFFRKLKIDFKNYKKPSNIDTTFYKYGFFASLSNVTSQLLFVIDIFLIGHLLKDATMVTNFKYVSLIPFSILFLPRAFIATDFVAFTEKIYDTAYIKKYIRGYQYFFSIISVLFVVFSLLFSKQLLQLFDNELTLFTHTFLILTIGICGILIFRGLFGNLLSSIGKAHINYYIASFALLLNIISNYYLIPKYGIKGAAITSAILMWFTGILSWLIFKFLYKKLE